jgi:hypothetical protein
MQTANSAVNNIIKLVKNVRDRRGDPGVDGRIMSGWIFKKWDVGVRTGLGWLRIGIVAGTCECGEEPSGSIKRGGFLD